MRGLNGSYEHNGDILTFTPTAAATVSVTLTKMSSASISQDRSVLCIVEIVRERSPSRIVVRWPDAGLQEAHKDVRVIVLEHCLRIAAANRLKWCDLIFKDCVDESVATAYPALIVGHQHYRVDVPLTTHAGVILFAPAPPTQVLHRTITLRVAQKDDRKLWNQLILASSQHNMGGAEMLTVTWDAPLKVVAVEDGAIVGLVCMSREGWIPYITSHGAPHSGLGSFLLFVAMEWFRLTSGHTVGLSPSDEKVREWYAGWGFSVLPSQRPLPITDVVMRRHIDLFSPLLPSSLLHYVDGLHIDRHRAPIYCVMCMGLFPEHSSENVPIVNAARPVPFKDRIQLLKHVERVHLREGSAAHQKSVCSIFIDGCGAALCSECQSGFDMHLCGQCDQCWYACHPRRKRGRSAGDATHL